MLVLISTLCFPVSVQAETNDRLVINIPSRTLDLYKNNKLVKTYPVGVGRANFQTPIGNFKVISLVQKPGWENPYKPVGNVRIHAGETNPLGTRWIGFKSDSGGEFGIHGTDNPKSVGQYSSHGCVRMLVKDAEDLFGKVTMNMPVYVTYDTTRLYVNKSDVYLKNYPDQYNKGTSDINTVKSSIKKMNSLVVWNASVALEAMHNKITDPVKIGIVINETDFQ
ncbi:MAG: L,D-transpeptidase [Vampirovibrionia bacterium]